MSRDPETDRKLKVNKLLVMDDTLWEVVGGMRTRTEQQEEGGRRDFRPVSLVPILRPLC